LSVRRQKKRSGSAARATRRQERIPENETTRLLREIGVRSSKVIADLASMPPDTVAAAAAAAKSRRTTRDLGGVVARMLCDLRDPGTPTPEPARSASACPTAAEIRASFERLGITLSEPELPGAEFGVWMDGEADVVGQRACLPYRAAEPADFAAQVR